MGDNTDKDTLRNETVERLKKLAWAQDLSWESMKVDVHAASDKVTFKRLELLEEKVQQLATVEYPTLLESVLGLLMTAVPVARIVGGLTNHFARSFTLGKIVGAVSAKGTRLPLSKGAVKQLEEIEKRVGSGSAVLKPENGNQWVREIVEYDQAVIKFTNTYAPEIEDSVRVTIKSAASALAKPIVGQEELFSQGQVAPAKSASDASDFLKEMRNWIVRSQAADKAVLEDLRDAVEKSDNLDHIKTVKKFLDFEKSNTSGQTKNYDHEAFQRFVEICIWCTTWDFTPRFRPAGRGPTIAQAGTRPAQFALPPLGDKFWEFATARYYDPFFGDGEKTFMQVGRSRSLGRRGALKSSPELDSYLNSPTVVDPGFYPSERLAFYFSNVIAPELFRFNHEISRLLESRGFAESNQSRPTELDVFYQYMLGNKKLEPSQ